ncbi:MAG: nucleotidyltransferase family protein [Coriobacteriales bacterium]|jgi:hypothetical protein|nr:nucleotidyltransferase family protein [Coriobacteriales bacterium]
MDTYQLFLESLRDDFVAADFPADKPRENQAFLQLVEKHRLHPFLFERCQSSMTDDLRGAISRLHTEDAKKRECAYRILSELVLKAQMTDVRFVVIKGLALEQCVYAEERRRDVGDIDILVPPENAVTMHEILLAMGYRQRKGPTSAKGSIRGKPRAFIAAHANQILDTFSVTEVPIRRHSGKPQYAPYIRQGSSTIELHDGFYRLATENLRCLFDHDLALSRNAGFPVFDVAATFLFLLINTYENSESFFSNNYDNKAILRDYVDMRFFFKRYRTSLIWSDIVQLIERFGLIHITEVILGNLLEIYGRDVTYGTLSHLHPKTSEWGVDILDRMQNPDLARKVSLLAFRHTLRGKTNPIPFVAQPEKNTMLPDLFMRVKASEEACYAIAHTSDSFTLLWLLPQRLKDGERYLLQLRLYPLIEDIPYTAYKVDYCFYGDRHHAFGHTTHSLFDGAIRKETKTELTAVESDFGTHHLIRIKSPFSLLGLLKCPNDDDFCVSAELFEQHHEHIYHRAGFDGDGVVSGGSESAPVFLLRFGA